mgnify:FL=1
MKAVVYEQTRWVIDDDHYYHSSMTFSLTEMIRLVTFRQDPHCNIIMNALIVASASVEDPSFYRCDHLTDCCCGRMAEQRISVN